MISSIQERNNALILKCLKNMPLKKGKKNIGANIKELMMDNKKKGKAKGANGKSRSRKQIIAIALNTAGMKKKK